MAVLALGSQWQIRISKCQARVPDEVVQCLPMRDRQLLNKPTQPRKKACAFLFGPSAPSCRPMSVDHRPLRAIRESICSGSFVPRHVSLFLPSRFVPDEGETTGLTLSVVRGDTLQIHRQRICSAFWAFSTSLWLYSLQVVSTSSLFSGSLQTRTLSPGHLRLDPEKRCHYMEWLVQDREPTP